MSASESEAALPAMCESLRNSALLQTEGRPKRSSQCNSIPEGASEEESEGSEDMDT